MDEVGDSSRQKKTSKRGDDGEGSARINLFDSTSESMSKFTYKLVVCGSQSYGCPGVDSDVDFVFVVDKNTYPKLSIFEIRSAVCRDINKQPGDYFDLATLEGAPLDERQNRFNELTSPTVGLNNDIPLISMFDTKEKMQLDVTFAWSSAKRVETNDQVIKCLDFIANRRPETRSAMECFKVMLEQIGIHGTKFGGIPNIAAVACMIRKSTVTRPGILTGFACTDAVVAACWYLLRIIKSKKPFSIESLSLDAKGQKVNLISQSFNKGCAEKNLVIFLHFIHKDVRTWTSGKNMCMRYLTALSKKYYSLDRKSPNTIVTEVANILKDFERHWDDKWSRYGSELFSSDPCNDTWTFGESGDNDDYVVIDSDSDSHESDDADVVD